MIQQLDHVALLPLYAAAGNAVLVLVTDLVLGRSTTELSAALGPAYEREVVHRDDLVLL